MKRIVIIGAGFAGLAAAKALRDAKADVLVKAFLLDEPNNSGFVVPVPRIRGWFTCPHPVRAKHQFFPRDA